MPRAKQAAGAMPAEETGEQPLAPADQHPTGLHRHPQPGETEIQQMTGLRRIGGWDGKPRGPIRDPGQEQANAEQQRHEMEARTAAATETQAAVEAQEREAALDAAATRVPDILQFHDGGEMLLDDTKGIIIARAPAGVEFTLPFARRYGQISFLVKVSPACRQALIFTRPGDNLDGKENRNINTGKHMPAGLVVLPGQTCRLQSDGVSTWWMF